MSDLFKSRYRISTSRYPDWDYASPGIYFVTICTKSHQHYFGEVINGEMHLNKIGEIVKQGILETPQIRKNISLDSWVIMPNHIHLIIVITQGEHVETPRRGVSTETINKWSSNSLGSIINHLKGACTRRIRSQINPDFAWQSRFYDHIIRTEQDLERLREYILLNPLNWYSDDPENRLREDDAHA
jgi:REP element-mobilizing transposase RayT